MVHSVVAGHIHDKSIPRPIISVKTQILSCTDTPVFQNTWQIFITQETLERQVAGNGSLSTAVLLLVDIMYSVVGQLGMSRLLNVQNSRLCQILNMLPP